MAGLETKTVLLQLSKLNKNRQGLPLEERLKKFAEIYADVFPNYSGDTAQIIEGNLNPICGRLIQLINKENSALRITPSRSTTALNGLMAFKETLDVLTLAAVEKQPELAMSGWGR